MLTLGGNACVISSTLMLSSLSASTASRKSARLPWSLSSSWISRISLRSTNCRRCGKTEKNLFQGTTSACLKQSRHSTFRFSCAISWCGPCSWSATMPTRLACSCCIMTCVSRCMDSDTPSTPPALPISCSSAALSLASAPAPPFSSMKRCTRAFSCSAASTMVKVLSVPVMFSAAITWSRSWSSVASRSLVEPHVTVRMMTFWSSTPLMNSCADWQQSKKLQRTWRSATPPRSNATRCLSTTGSSSLMRVPSLRHDVRLNAPLMIIAVMTSAAPTICPPGGGMATVATVWMMS
mmetsp:Transcript_25854/g.76583  ORF Transcript_25854/g.76583 Transcript_25854/m.76583 type:complete len:294 (-) Transcript_25854:276-1157(-)